MSKKPAYTAAQWLRYNYENRLGAALRLKESSLAAIGAVMDEKIPDATSEERESYLNGFLAEFGAYHLRPESNVSGYDLKRMNASERLAVSNGEVPHFIAGRNKK